MLIGVISYFQEIKNLEKYFDTWASQVDKIIAVDGAYSEFPYMEFAGDFLSNDGSTEFLKSRGATVLLPNRPWPLQVAKRNAYLLGTEGDYYLHMDADEELVGRIELPLADVGLLRMTFESDGRQELRTRIFKHVKGIHYADKHYWLKDGDGNTVTLLSKAGENYESELLEASIIHHDVNRCRDSFKKTYYRQHILREHRIMERL